MSATFGELAPILADFGYSPVPIRPGAKAPMIEDWQAGHPPEHYLPRYADWGTGILTATCPALDLDIRDRELVRVLIELAGDMLGPLAVPDRRAAKGALAVLDQPSRSTRSSGRWFALPGDDWRDPAYAPHRIEILGDGQQFVAYARHPRGTYYRWARGEPMDTPLIDLPEINQASAQSFLWTAHGVIRDLGAVALVRREQVWFPDTWVPEDFGEPEQPKRREYVDTTADREWQKLDPETLAKLIDLKHASRTRDGWITSCPAHKSIGQRSLSITPRSGGGSVVHCFAECPFPELAREISAIVGRRAA